MEMLKKEGEANFKMTDKQQPHEQMTEKNNGLTSTQEVLYDEEFQRADHVGKNEKKQKNTNNKK